MNQENGNKPSCVKSVDGCQCPKCSSINIVRNGNTRNAKQRFCCKDCGKSFITDYSYKACQSGINQQIVLFTKEGLGIRSTARVLKISATTLLKRIISIAKNIEQPPIVKGKTYEVDEMRTFIGKKSLLHSIVYALARRSKPSISMAIYCRFNYYY